jgi:ABC-2 type transport system ATP-binding protein
MEEAERLADRIAIIAGGRIIAQGTPRTLGGRDSSEARITFALPPGTSAAADLPPMLAERAEPQSDGRVALTSRAVAADLHALSGWALEQGAELDDLEVRRATLEDVYLTLVADYQRAGG